MSIPDFSENDAMRGVLTRFVKLAGAKSNRSKPRWAHVSMATGHGSGYAVAICIEFGVDPDEIVGGLQLGKYYNACGACQYCGTTEEFECCDQGEGPENEG